ncbi:hypothetical protein N9I65_03025 [bacterium]|nr:hypothetical protein [bacterium]
MAGTPEARDEYQSYSPRVFKMIVEEIPAEHIKNYLIRVETEQMGLSQREGRSEQLDVLLNSLYVSRELLLDSTS